jgi:hypothetical protein
MDKEETMFTFRKVRVLIQMHRSMFPEGSTSHRRLTAILDLVEKMLASHESIDSVGSTR